MSTRIATRTILRLVIAGASLLSIACAESSTAPALTRSIQSTQAAAHDDDPPPPDEVCESGWITVDGRWVCED